MKKFGFLLALSFFLLLGCAGREELGKTEVAVHARGGADYSVLAEVADSDSERAQGLMWRENLPENSGMLFVFEDEGYPGFWMKNTLIPLDMIFISENRTIVSIARAAPCKSEPCRVYSPKKPAKYVLEVNGGWSERNRVREGDSVEFSLAG